jgi:uncharacterized membrane protein
MERRSPLHTAFVLASLVAGSLLTFLGCTEARPIEISHGREPSAPVAEDPFVPFLPDGAGGMSGLTGGTSGAAGIGLIGGTSGAAGTGLIGGSGVADIPAAADLLPLNMVPMALSSDGSVAAGVESNDPSFPMAQRAFRWTAATGPVLLNLARPTHNLASVAGISSDGTTVIGSSLTFSFGERVAVRWTASGAVEELGFAGDVESVPVAVSVDGKVIAGTSMTVCPVACERAFRWTTANGSVPLPTLGDDPGGGALAMSNDGSTIVGYSSGATNQHHRAFYWTAATGTIELGEVGSGSLIIPRAVSDRGDVVIGDILIGEADDPGITNVTSVGAFLWTPSGGMVVLGTLPGRLQSRATGISRDGTIIVGHSFNFDGTREVDSLAFRWANAILEGLPKPPTFDGFVPAAVSGNCDVIAGLVLGEGMLPFTAGVWQNGIGTHFLAPALGPNLQLLRSVGVQALSEDGAIIAGQGTDGSNVRHGWLARLR